VTVEARSGLSVLMQRGLLAWMQLMCSAVLPAPAPRTSLAFASSPCLPESTSLVQVLAGMLLALDNKGADDGTRKRTEDPS
jgi:hypothetical protein